MSQTGLEGARVKREPLFPNPCPFYPLLTPPPPVPSTLSSHPHPRLKYQHITLGMAVSFITRCNRLVRERVHAIILLYSGPTNNSRVFGAGVR